MTTEQNRAEQSRAGQSRAVPADADAAKTESPKKSLADLRKDAHAARSEVASTLDAIEYKLNIRKQIKISTRRLTYGLRDLGDRNPAALIGIAVAAASVAGVAAWLGARAVQRR
jgi:hypothetical protein